MHKYNICWENQKNRSKVSLVRFISIEICEVFHSVFSRASKLFLMHFTDERPLWMWQHLNATSMELCFNSPQHSEPKWKKKCVQWRRWVLHSFEKLRWFPSERLKNFMQAHPKCHCIRLFPPRNSSPRLEYVKLWIFYYSFRIGCEALNSSRMWMWRKLCSFFFVFTKSTYEKADRKRTIDDFSMGSGFVVGFFFLYEGQPNQLLVQLT